MSITRLVFRLCAGWLVCLTKTKLLEEWRLRCFGLKPVVLIFLAQTTKLFLHAFAQLYPISKDYGTLVLHYAFLSHLHFYPHLTLFKIAIWLPPSFTYRTPLPRRWNFRLFWMSVQANPLGFVSHTSTLSTSLSFWLTGSILLNFFSCLIKYSVDNCFDSFFFLLNVFFF